jgi:hypothetical protein
VPISAAIIGGIGAVGSIGSAVIGSNAATSAADTQAAAAKSAQDTQLQMFQTAQTAQQPYNMVGQSAVNSLADLYSLPNSGNPNSSGGGTAPGTLNPASLNAFTNSPDYQFALQQGTQAMQRSAAAGGTLISGGQLKAGQEFGQGLATQQFGNYYNRLLSLAQIGQSAASGVSNAAVTSGANIGNSIQAGGQATASGIVGSANAIAGGLQGTAGSLSTATLLSNPLVQQKLLGNGNNGSLSSYTPSQIGQIGNMPAGLATDDQAAAYGTAMGL